MTVAQPGCMLSELQDTRIQRALQVRAPIIPELKSVTLKSDDKIEITSACTCLYLSTVKLSCGHLLSLALAF